MGVPRARVGGVVALVALIVPTAAVSGCSTSHSTRPAAAATYAATPMPSPTTPAPSPRPTATRSVRTVPSATPTPAPTHQRAAPPPTCRKDQIDLSFRMDGVRYARGKTVTFTTVVRNHSASACGIDFMVPCYDSVAVVTAHSHWVWSSGNCELVPPPAHPRPLPAHGRLTFVTTWDQRPSCTPVGCGPTPPPRVPPATYYAHATALVSWDTDRNFTYVRSQQIAFVIQSP